MQRSPRTREDRLLTGGLLVRACLFLGVMEAIGAMAAFVFVLLRAGWQWGDQLASTDVA
jgi:sodium/potassium-transporting ATPase subunit alpha